jgi:hypothetical protein
MTLVRCGPLEASSKLHVGHPSPSSRGTTGSRPFPSLRLMCWTRWYRQCVRGHGLGLPLHSPQFLGSASVRLSLLRGTSSALGLAGLMVSAFGGLRNRSQAISCTDTSRLDHGLPADIAQRSKVRIGPFNLLVASDTPAEQVPPPPGLPGQRKPHEPLPSPAYHSISPAGWGGSCRRAMSLCLWQRVFQFLITSLRVRFGRAEMPSAWHIRHGARALATSAQLTPPSPSAKGAAPQSFGEPPPAGRIAGLRSFPARDISYRHGGGTARTGPRPPRRERVYISRRSRTGVLDSCDRPSFLAVTDDAKDFSARLAAKVALAG